MKKKINFVPCLLLLLLTSIPTFSQGPGEPYNPMTAPGSRHINRVNNQYFAHKLFWENPANTNYNDIYLSLDSSSVISLDSSALVLSGYDSSKTFSELSLNILGTLEHHTKYYWRVVEFNNSSPTIGPVWHFITESGFNFWSDHFDNDLEEYIKQPQESGWITIYSSNAGGTAPELMYLDISEIGISYLILDDFFDLSPSLHSLSFKYGVQFYLGYEFTIGLAYSLDEGNSWIPIWQQVVTENITPTQVYSVPIPNENYIKLALFCISTVPYPAGHWYVDDLILDSPLTVPSPPSQIQALADNSVLRVLLNWSPGWAVDPVIGYRIQRKNGLPTSTASYQNIIDLGPYELSFEDSTVQLGTIYTYRIQTIFGNGGVTDWSNEATAYVPDNITSVEIEEELPREFYLSQNYPNPFNPTTKIRYNIPSVETHRDASQQVTLKVYDVLGNEVATLVNEEKPVGTYEVEFNTANHSGEVRNLTSGIYFFQLKADSFIETKKMILLK